MVGVESPNPRNQPNDALRGNDGAALVSGTLGEDRRWLRSVFEESREQLRSQSRELALLHRVRSAVARDVEVSSVLSGAVEAVAETYGYAAVGAYLLEGDDLVLQHQVGYRGAIERIPLTRGVCGRVIRTGRPELVEDVSGGANLVGAKEGVASEICVPLFDEDEVVGCLDV